LWGFFGKTDLDMTLWIYGPLHPHNIELARQSDALDLRRAQNPQVLHLPPTMNNDLSQIEGNCRLLPPVGST
jgi:hypothetical protein